MSINERVLTIEGLKCYVHLPEKPNGFAILLLGDKHHFVHSTTSSWIQHPLRNQFLNRLIDEGYTVFYCDPKHIHWGNDQVFHVVERLVKYVLTSEIINEKIHIFAEGIGALIAFRLMTHQFIQIRSIILYNPCIDLFQQYEEEKKNRFFYKRFIQEIKEAYRVEEKNVEKLCKEKSLILNDIPMYLPFRVFQVIYQAPYNPDIHIRSFIQRRKDIQRELITTFYMPGKTVEQFSSQMINFYRKHEKKLKMYNIRKR
ncbi:hypothetical protein [Evansella cellulosilytica]|uniref:Alpha/beta hydrolase n=1 Tax=Evansella cellulosilytica (strain ATCC 21833 / DSM 2522 / FERM P-1141 / JCM 9156 / N-4) TaxID=649639 RepID=E6TXW4_EVAC2|nr:hypothetical protein [Evansella cellulosilytica]ADU31177.1 hypothetical protein Bcell_2926 [Evansella cellulosilytica DSM 2522]